MFGFNEKYQSLSNLAIDRIISLQEAKVNFIPNTDINFEDYFDDVVGVSVKSGASSEKVILKISKEVWPYIESKPLHGSQKLKSKTDTYVQIELNVQINHELMALLFSYMDAIEILEPQDLRHRFKTLAEMIYNKYI